MDEEKTTEGKEQETPTADTKTGDKPAELTEIDKVHAAAKRMEKANEERNRIIQEEKESEAKRIIGGKASAPPQEETSKEVTDADRIKYGEDALKGIV